MEQNWNTLGIEAVKKGDYQEAIKIFKEGLAEEPENVHLIYNVGTAYAELVKKDLDYVNEAVEWFTRGIRLGHANSWNGLGSMFDPMFKGKFSEKMKDKDKAIECYKKTLEMTNWEGKNAGAALHRIGMNMLTYHYTVFEGAAYLTLAKNYPGNHRQMTLKVLQLCKEKINSTEFARLADIKASGDMFKIVSEYYEEKAKWNLGTGVYGSAVINLQLKKRAEDEAGPMENRRTDNQRRADAMNDAAEYYAKKGEYFVAAAFARGAWKLDNELEKARANQELYILGMKQEDQEQIKNIESESDAFGVLNRKKQQDREEFWSRPIDEILTAPLKEKKFTVDKEEKKSGALDELEALIGMESLKKDVREMISMMKVQKMREDAGMKTISTSKHLVFTGNPGTGKTTVARIIGRVYKDLGILSGGQIVEVAREDLVAGYVGQTALKTQEKIEEAMGGILFIDEAYTLAKGGNDFGQEAIDAILKVMEDNRDDFVVIVAGYPNQMEDFINSNPGLKSRFSKYLHFPDYSAEEMEEIFFKMAESSDFVLDDGAKGAMKQCLADIEANKDENFANAREVRNLLEKISMKQALRLAQSTTVSLEELKTIRLSDVIESTR